MLNCHVPVNHSTFLSQCWLPIVPACTEAVITIAFSTIVAMASFSKAIESKLPDYVLLLLGPPRAGKSTVGNIIAGETVFSIEGHGPMTLQTKQHTYNDGEYHLLIDTVGLGEESKSQDDVLLELTTAVLMAADAGGIHAFLICVNFQSLSSIHTLTELDDLEEMKNFWPHAILVFTNSGVYSCLKIAKQRQEAIHYILRDGPPSLESLKEKVEDRIVFLESSHIIFGGDYDEDRLEKIWEIMNLVKIIVNRQGVYNNSMMQEAKVCWNSYKLKVQKMGKQAPAPHQPSYEEVAAEIVRVPSGGSRPFYRIWHGIREVSSMIRSPKFKPFHGSTS